MTAMALGGAILGGSLGSVVGYFVGRTRAEWGRARFDAGRTVGSRSDYRK